MAVRLERAVDQLTGDAEVVRRIERSIEPVLAEALHDHRLTEQRIS